MNWFTTCTRRGVSLERLAEVVTLVNYGDTVAEAVRRAGS